MTIYQLTRTGAQIDEKIKDVYGGIHSHDNSTAQSIPTGATYTKVLNWTDNDEANNVTPDYTTGIITVDEPGIYRVEGSFSFKSGTNNVEYFGSIFLDDVEIDSIHFTRKIATAGDVGNTSVTGLLSITASQVLDLRIRHSNGSSVNTTFSYMNLNITRVGL